MHCKKDLMDAAKGQFGKQSPNDAPVGVLEMRF